MGAWEYVTFANMRRVAVYGVMFYLWWRGFKGMHLVRELHARVQFLEVLAKARKGG